MAENDIENRGLNRDYRISRIIKAHDLSPEMAEMVCKTDLDGDGTISMEELLLSLTEKLKEERKNRNLKKAIVLFIVFVFLLAGSNFATSIVAAYLSKEIEISKDGKLVNVATKEEIAVKSVGVAEFFWLNPIPKEDIISEVENSADKPSVVVGRGCARKHQVENLFAAVLEGTAPITGFAFPQNNDEAIIELSSDASRVGNTSCITSRDGEKTICFEEVEDCFEEEFGQRKLQHVHDFVQGSESCVHRRRLSESGPVARKLCSTGGGNYDEDEEPAAAPVQLVTVSSPTPRFRLWEDPYARWRDPITGRYSG